MKTKPQIQWNLNDEDFRHVRKIAKRMVTIADEMGDDVDQQSCFMDIAACHLNGNPLKLEALLKADDFNFIHDAFGISKHLDRTTGGLLNHFLPRYSA